MILNCTNFGIEFEQKKWHKTGSRIFCTRQCYFEHRRKSATTECAHCGAKVKKSSKHELSLYKNNFCDRKCMGNFYKKGTIKTKCNYCGKKVEKQLWAAKGKNVYCSQKCKNKFRTTKVESIILSKVIGDLSAGGNNPMLKEITKLALNMRFRLNECIKALAILGD